MDIIDVIDKRIKKKKVSEPEGIIQQVHAASVTVKPRGSFNTIECAYNNISPQLVGKRCTYQRIAGGNKYVVTAIFNPPNQTDITVFAGSSHDDHTLYDNIGGQILKIKQKDTPIDNDLLLLEDSADSYRKKRVRVGDLPSSGGGGSGGLFILTAATDISFTDDPVSLFSSGVGDLTLPSNWLTTGRTIQIHSVGYMSTAEPDVMGTLILSLDGVVLASLDDYAFPVLISQGWSLNAQITCRDDSTPSATVVIGSFIFTFATDGTGVSQFVPVINNVEQTFDKTDPLVLDLTWKWSAADGSNQLLVVEATVQFIEVT